MQTRGVAFAPVEFADAAAAQEENELALEELEDADLAGRSRQHQPEALVAPNPASKCPFHRLFSAGSNATASKPAQAHPSQFADFFNAAKDKLGQFIQSKLMPCMGGKMALSNRGMHELKTYEAMGSQATGAALANDLRDFIQKQDAAWAEGKRATTFIAAFPGGNDDAPWVFERELFDTLQALHDHDTSPWPEGATKNENAADFQFCFGGRSFFIVGLSPNNEREGRRAPVRMIAFNAQRQFDQAFNDKIDTIREVSRRKDAELSAEGFNPNVGVGPNAASFSGCRNFLDPYWTAPLRIR